MEAFTVTIPQLAGAIAVDPVVAQMQLSAMLVAGLIANAALPVLVAFAVLLGMRAGRASAQRSVGA